MLSGPTLLLVRRSIRRALATPANYMPGVVMPLLLVAINSQSLQRLTSFDGFPVERFLDFILVLAFIQGAMVATSTAGLGLARDMETGFLNRVALTPVRTRAVVLAQIAGSATIALVSASGYLIAGVALGVDVQSGLLGALVLLLLAGWIAGSFAMIGSWVALRSGGGETLQSLAPVLFGAMMLSTVNMPREFIDAGWFRTITTINPVSYLVDGMRGLIITGWDPATLMPAVAITAGLFLLALGGCARSLRGRGVMAA